MYLSMNIMYDRLDVQEKTTGKTSENHLRKFRGILCYKASLLYDWEILSEYLLLGKGTDFPLELKGYGLLSLGPLPDPLKSKNAWMELSGDCDLYQVMYQAERVFYQFNRWEQELLAHLEQEDFLKVACRATAEVLENPVLFHDNGQILHAWSDLSYNESDWTYNKEIGKYSLSISLLNQFKVAPEYEASMLTRQSALYDDNSQEYPVLYCNFFVVEQFMGRYCVPAAKREIRGGDYQILDYVNELTGRAFAYGKLLLVNQMKEIESLFIAVMQGESVEDARLTAQLSVFGWDQQDQYLCIVIPLEERDSTTYTAISSCLDLKHRFPGGFVYIFEKNIVLLVNLDKEQMELGDVSARLAYFLREGIFKAGISVAKRAYGQLRDAYREALAALEIGNVMEPTKWCYSFQDYLLDYMYWKSTRELSVDSLCCGGLLLLRQYDKAHNTQLFHTLEVYLNQDRNLAHTSGKLFIHRSTLQYRLDRIGSLLGMDLDDPKVRLLLLNSFGLLRWAKKDE